MKSRRGIKDGDGKVQVSYMIPTSLARDIRRLAADYGQGIRPCHVVTAYLRHGIDAVAQGKPIKVDK